MSTSTTFPPPVTPTPRSSSSSSEPAPPKRGVRIAWLVPGAILASAALAWGTFTVLSLLAHGQRIERLTFPTTAATTLDVRVDAGSVAVIGTDTSEIAVRADISDGWARSELTGRVSGDVVEVRGHCPVLGTMWCRTALTIEVPADMRVIVASFYDAVTITGIAAAVNVANEDGRVTLVDVSGPVVATNEHGRIEGRRLSSPTVDAHNEDGRVELSFLSPPDAVTVRTELGRVEIVVPDLDTAYRVEAASRSGATDTLIRTDPSSAHTIDVTSRHGTIIVRPPG